MDWRVARRADFLCIGFVIFSRRCRQQEPCSNLNAPNARTAPPLYLLLVKEVISASGRYISQSAWSISDCHLFSSTYTYINNMTGISMRIVLAALMVGGASASAATSLRTSALPVEGMRDARELSEDYAWDDDFFTFNDNTLWTDYAINPKRCVEL